MQRRQSGWLAAIAMAVSVAACAAAQPSGNPNGSAAAPVISDTRSENHPAAQLAPPREIDWQTSPLDLDLRGMNGEKYTFYCPPGKPEPSFVAGSGPYTDASSICTAAVHAGAIRPVGGGNVTIEIRPGENGGYLGSERNYIKTNSFDQPWSGSFVVVAPASSAAHNAAFSTLKHH